MLRTSKWRFGICVLGWMLCAFSGTTVAQLLTYDNFNSRQIDPAKWSGTFGDSDQREIVREVVGEGRSRRLHLAQRVYSATTDDSGGSGDVFGLEFAHPNAVTEVSLSVRVQEAEVLGCTTNPSLSVIDAEFRGNFFNVESSPTSPIGDVVAVIAVSRYPTDTTNALTVAGFYTRCDDEFCGSQTPLDYRVLGSVQPGTTNTLHLKWDQPGHRFVFGLNDQPEVASTYTVSDTTPAVFSYKAIGFARVIPHCTSTPRPFAEMDAFFDNVRVNP